MKKKKATSYKQIKSEKRIALRIKKKNYWCQLKKRKKILEQQADDFKIFF